MSTQHVTMPKTSSSAFFTRYPFLRLNESHIIAIIDCFGSRSAENRRRDAARAPRTQAANRKRIGKPAEQAAAQAVSASAQPRPRAPILYFAAAALRAARYALTALRTFTMSNSTASAKKIASPNVTAPARGAMSIKNGAPTRAIGKKNATRQLPSRFHKP